MFFLTWIRKLYKVLSADASPTAIAIAAGFGISLGFLPLWSGAAILLIALLLVIRVQLTTALAFWGIGALLRVPLATTFELMGERMLEAAPARDFWVRFLNLPVVAWLDLDCYAVLGGAVSGLSLALILFFPLRMLVIGYRRWAHEKLSKNRFFRWLTSFWLTKALRFLFIGGSGT